MEGVMAAIAFRVDDAHHWPASVKNEQANKDEAEARRKRQMSLIKGIVSDYAPALRELANR